MIRQFIVVVVLLITVSSFAKAGVGETATPSAIAVLPGDGDNLRILEQLSSTRLTMTFSTPAHNWFAGQFTHLPTDADVTMGFSMAGQDAGGNIADVLKWQGLVPVMTYGDPAQYACYTCYRKDARGHWISADPLTPVAERDAGEGKVPRQATIPAAQTEQFLCDAGKSWIPWREITHTTVLPKLNIFRLQQRFELPTATVAMRVPFTYSYLQAFVERLRVAHLPGVGIDEVGVTSGGRKLQVIRLDDTQTNPAADHATILVVAREHATEPAGSWALFGMMSALLADTPAARRARAGITWLFIPIEDPDGSAEALFEHLTNTFLKFGEGEPTEPLAYETYLTHYVYAHNRPIDLTLSLHNVEVNEAPNIVCPFQDATLPAEIPLDINHRVFAILQDAGYQTPPREQPWLVASAMLDRLYGWCAQQFFGVDLAFEINDRYPKYRLTLPKLQRLGAAMGSVLAQWCVSTEGRNWHKNACARLQIKMRERERYFMQKGYLPTRHTPYDIVVHGY